MGIRDFTTYLLEADPLQLCKIIHAYLESFIQELGSIYTYAKNGGSISSLFVFWTIHITSIVCHVAFLEM